jgi:hypothetical protein
MNVTLILALIEMMILHFSLANKCTKKIHPRSVLNVLAKNLQMDNYNETSLYDSVNKLILRSLMAVVADQIIMTISQIKGDLDAQAAQINTQLDTLQKEINDLYEFS